jgi:hypothetical protein
MRRYLTLAAILALVILGRVGLDYGGRLTGLVPAPSPHRPAQPSSSQARPQLVATVGHGLNPLVGGGGGVPSGCRAERPRVNLRLETSLHRPAFIPRCVVAEAHTHLVLRLEDNLSGIPVNISIAAAGPDASIGVISRPGHNRARPVFAGRVASSPGLVNYHVGPLAPGVYILRCDSYPTSMTAILLARTARGPAHE